MFRTKEPLMRKFVVTLSCIALVLGAVALTGCGSSKKSNNNSAAPATAPQGAGKSSSSSSTSASSSGKASIGDNFFQPKQIKVKAGTKVTWTNDGQVQHTVTADDGSFDSGSVDPDSTFSTTFDAPGTYQYYCAPHGSAGLHGMAATIVVDDPAGG